MKKPGLSIALLPFIPVVCYLVTLGILADADTKDALEAPKYGHVDGHVQFRLDIPSHDVTVVNTHSISGEAPRELIAQGETYWLQIWKNDGGYYFTQVEYSKFIECQVGMTWSWRAKTCHLQQEV